MTFHSYNPDLEGRTVAGIDLGTWPRDFRIYADQRACALFEAAYWRAVAERAKSNEGKAWRRAQALNTEASS